MENLNKTHHYKRDMVLMEKKEPKNWILSSGFSNIMEADCFLTTNQLHADEIPEELKENGDLAGKCISCEREFILNNSYDGKKIVAGHLFKSDRHESVRYYRMNVHIQCAQHCNIAMSGNEAKYTANLIRVYGIEEYEKLVFLANQVKKLIYKDYIKIILESREIIKLKTEELDI